MELRSKEKSLSVLHTFGEHPEWLPAAGKPCGKAHQEYGLNTLKGRETRHASGYSSQDDDIDGCRSRSVPAWGGWP